MALVKPAMMEIVTEIMILKMITIDDHESDNGNHDYGDLDSDYEMTKIIIIKS